VKVCFRDLLGGGGDRAQRPQDPSRDQPAQHPGENDHNGQGERGLDLELVQIGDPLLGADEPDHRAAGRGPQDALTGPRLSVHHE
jgi:hypothetical protein